MKNHILQKLIAFVLIWGLITAIFSGCVSEKKLLDKATMRVLTNKSAFDSVGRVFVELHPCLNDSAPPVIRPGRIDSVPVIIQVPVFDSFAQIMTIDSVKAAYSGECNSAIDAAYKKGFTNGAMAATNEFSKMKIPVKQPDTAIYNIKDRQLERINAETISELNKQVEYHKGVNTQIVTQNNKSASQRDMYMMLFYGSWVVAIGVGIFIFYNKKKADVINRVI